MKMRKKISIHLLSIAVLTIISTLIIVSGVYYGLLKKQVFYDLKSYAHLLASLNYEEYIQTDKNKEQIDDLRITFIAPDGKVLYDNEADITKMVNHKNRPEVMEAVKNGEGNDIRSSQTLKISTFYYAEKLEDGSVLRVAKKTSIVYSAVKKALPVMSALIMILFLICVLCTVFITKSIVAPIEEMANHLNEGALVPKYKELNPFAKEIQKRHADIIKVSEIRQEFTANVSHELKTPLASISGYSELIETGVASGDDVIHFAQEIHQNTNRLLVLINDIIRLSQLDSTDYAVVFEKVDLFETAKECVDMLAINANQYNIDLIFSGEPVTVDGNASMLQEVIYNLIDNAIRYNRKNGKVMVQTEDTPKGAKVIVEDNGIGISKEDKERIFERFYRVDKSHSKETGGTGLGLAIVKHILLKHNAVIEVESELGRGTKMVVQFYRE